LPDATAEKQQRPDCVQPLSRNTAQGASRIQKGDGATLDTRSRLDHVFFIFFFFFGLLAMMCFLFVLI
jgi:hypothetical protein